VPLLSAVSAFLGERQPLDLEAHLDESLGERVIACAGRRQSDPEFFTTLWFHGQKAPLKFQSAGCAALAALSRDEGRSFGACHELND
jgi:hypothetical protein